MKARNRMDRPARVALQRVNLVDEVVHALEEEILGGRYAPDATLPSEGDLAGQFGVSRTVTREAMRVLSSRGLVEVAQGKAPRVREADPTTVVESIEIFLKRQNPSPLELIEARMPLETTSAALAAERATPAQIDALRGKIADEKRAETPAQVIAADIAFHEALAEATGNPVSAFLQSALTHLISDYFVQVIAVIGLKKQNGVSGHDPILEAIAAHDPEAARRAMTIHLERAAATCRAAGFE